MTETFKRSIGKRITRTLVLFTLAVAAIFTAITLVAVLVAEDKVIDQLLEANVQWLVEHHSRTGRVAARDSKLVTVYRAHQLPSHLDVHMAARAGGEFALGSEHFHFVRVELKDRQKLFLVAEVSDLLSVSAIRGDLMTLLALGLLASTLAALWIAYRLGRYFSQPTVALAGRVVELCRQQRIDIYPGREDSELDYLAAVIEHSLQKLSDLLERERHFNKDVGHELRTPLTIIKNQLALSIDRECSHRDLSIIADAASDVERIVAALLALARAESQHCEPLDLVALIEQSLLERETQLRSMTVEMNLPHHSVMVIGNAALVQQVLGNLIDNAVTHGRGDSVRIEFDDDWLCFTNDVSAEGRSDSMPAGRDPGLGRGLHLVERMLQTMNWQLNICEHDNTFRVALLPVYC